MHGGRPFDIQRGVKQGDILSPMLFNAALECALRKWKGKCEHHGIAMGHHERLTNIRYADDLMLYARSLPALVGMIETLSGELHQIDLQLNATKNKIFTAKRLDHPMYVEVSQDLVHVLHEGSSHKYLGRHILGNLKQRGCVELHHRKTIAWAKFNKHRTIVTNKHVSLKLRLEILQCCCHASHAFQFAHVGIDESALRKALTYYSAKCCDQLLNGEDWFNAMGRMNHRLSVALELFPIPPWTEQLAKRQFLLAAKKTSEQSWSSIAGHWTCASGWHANFHNMPCRKRGRPLVKRDDKLSNITNQLFPLHHAWLAAAKTAFLAKCATILCFNFLWISRWSSFSSCPYGIVVVVFHSGGRKAKQNKKVRGDMRFWKISRPRRSSGNFTIAQWNEPMEIVFGS